MFEYIKFINCYGEGFTPQMIREETRKSEVVYTRQLIMYFGRKYKVGSLYFIGDLLGQDHATVSHAVKTINNYLDTDKAKKAKIEYYDKIIERVIVLNKKGEDIKAIIDPIEKQISELEARCINLTLQLSFLKTNLDKCKTL